MVEVILGIKVAAGLDGVTHLERQAVSSLNGRLCRVPRHKHVPSGPERCNGVATIPGLNPPRPRDSLPHRAMSRYKTGFNFGQSLLHLMKIAPKSD